MSRVAVLDATWPTSRGARGLAFGLARLARQARAASRRGFRLVVLSDRAAGPRRMAIPSILAVGRVNQELVAAGRRSRTDVAVEAGDAFDVHDVAMLVAVGASAVHPWLMLELAAEVAGERGFEDLEPDEARRNTIAALEQGLRKVLARMGTSALSSYRGGQIFDVDRPRCRPRGALLPGGEPLAGIGRGAAARGDDRHPAPARVRRRDAGARGPGLRPLPRLRRDPRLRAEGGEGPPGVRSRPTASLPPIASCSTSRDRASHATW